MRYVTNMLARPRKITVAQMSAAFSVDQAMEIYLKNAFVCLSTVKRHNPDDLQCILFTDFELSEEWKTRFESLDIRLEIVPFGNFQISDNFQWGIVQYRYDVMHALCLEMNDADEVIMLDTDMICVGSLDNVFKEIAYRPCLYDVQHVLDHPDRLNIRNNFRKLYPESFHCELIHYGGEFIGANGSDLRQIFNESIEIIRMANSTPDLVNFNDEHITSMAIYRLNLSVNNANAYTYRYWTNSFYLTSTNYQYNPVVLWHLPAEKNDGMLWMYRVLIRGRQPSIQQMARVFGFPPAKRRHGLSYYAGKLRKKLTKK